MLSQFEQFVGEQAEWFRGLNPETTAAVEQAERQLGVLLPTTLKWLLTQYGYWRATGVGALPFIVAATQAYRPHFPEHWVVLARSANQPRPEATDPHAIPGETGLTILIVSPDSPLDGRAVLQCSPRGEIVRKFNGYSHYVVALQQHLEQAARSEYRVCLPSFHRNATSLLTITPLSCDVAELQLRICETILASQLSELSETVTPTETPSVTETEYAAAMLPSDVVPGLPAERNGVSTEISNAEETSPATIPFAASPSLRLFVPTELFAPTDLPDGGRCSDEQSVPETAFVEEEQQQKETLSEALAVGSRFQEAVSEAAPVLRRALTEAVPSVLAANMVVSTELSSSEAEATDRTEKRTPEKKLSSASRSLQASPLSEADSAKSPTAAHQQGWQQALTEMSQRRRERLAERAVELPASNFIATSSPQRGLAPLETLPEGDLLLTPLELLSELEQLGFPREQHVCLLRWQDQQSLRDWALSWVKPTQTAAVNSGWFRRTGSAPCWLLTCGEAVAELAPRLQRIAR